VSQGLESQTRLKWSMASGTMDIFVVTVLDIWAIRVPCMGMLRIFHAQDVHNHPIDDLKI
jgi:hypothetical protein